MCVCVCVCVCVCALHQVLFGSDTWLPNHRSGVGVLVAAPVIVKMENYSVGGWWLFTGLLLLNMLPVCACVRVCVCVCVWCIGYT